MLSVEPGQHDVARLVAGVAPVGVDERRRELRQLVLRVGLVGRVELALCVGGVAQAVLGRDALAAVDEALGDRAVEVGADGGEHEDAEQHRHDDDAEAERGPPQVEQPAPRAGAAPSRPARPGPRVRSGPRAPLISGRARLVPDAAHGHDDLGVLGVVLDLRAQPLDVDVDEPGVTGVAVAPDLLEQHLAGEDLPRLAREGDEQVELERRQRERLAVALDRVAGDVDLEVADRRAARAPARRRGAAGRARGR